jgi:hypothetical protein
MSGSAVGFALADRLQENGEALDHDAFEVNSHADYAARVTDSALGMTRIAAASGHHLVAIRLTWTEDVRAHAMRVMEALRASAQAPVETVEVLAASESVARSIASDKIAVCVLARDTAVALMLGDRTTIRGHRGNAVARWLTRELDQGPWRPERMLVVCSHRELEALAAQLAGALSIPAIDTRQAHVVLAIAVTSGENAAGTIARTVRLSPRRRATAWASAAAVVLAVSVVSGSDLRFDSPSSDAAASAPSAPLPPAAEAPVNQSLVPEALPETPPQQVQREVVPEAIAQEKPPEVVTPVPGEVPAQVHDTAPARQAPAEPVEQHLQAPTVRPPGQPDTRPADVSTAPPAELPAVQPALGQPPLIQLPMIPQPQAPPAQVPPAMAPPVQSPPQQVSPEQEPAPCVLLCGFAL